MTQNGLRIWPDAAIISKFPFYFDNFFPVIVRISVRDCTKSSRGLVKLD